MREIERGKKSAQRVIAGEIKKLEQQTRLNYGIDADIPIPQAFKSIEQKRLEAKLRDYKDLYQLTGSQFKKRAKELGIYNKELQYRRAFVFRETYMRIMREKYRNFDNFNKFESWARKHKNPISFYNDLPDAEFHPNDIQYQSDTTFQQEVFNSFLESLGINIEQ